MLIKLVKDNSDFPVILYSPEITLKDNLFCISENSSIFFANDLTSLKKMVKEIIKIKGLLKKKILFVDDEKNILRAYQRMLRKSSWDFVTALNGKETLEILKIEKIDLVVTDIKMPKMHGMESISKIRETNRDIPIIICSAYMGMKKDHNLKYYDAACFLEKPVDPVALKNKINELLS